MVGEPDLLFGDVEFLDVEDHLLFQAVVIYFGLQLRQTLPDAGADGFRAGFFERNDLLFVRFYPVDALQKIGDQNRSLLRAEFVQMASACPTASSTAACSCSLTLSSCEETTSGRRRIDWMRALFSALPGVPISGCSRQIFSS